MDFMEALNASGQVIVVILAVNLMIYYGRIREVISDVTPGTRRALYSYGLSGFGMIAASLVSINPPTRFFVMSAGAFFLGFILYAEMWILFEEKRAKQGGNITILLMLLSLVGTLGGEYIHSLFDMLTMTSLLILLIGTIYFTVVLLRENPTTFTASLLAVLVLYLATWVIGMTGWTFANPEFYVLQILPLIVAASIFGSVRRPWRRTLALFIMLTNFSVLVPLITTSYYSNEIMIWGVLMFELIAGIALIAPIEYFSLQATKTGSLTSRYLGIVVSCIALLTVSHGLSWAVFQSNGGVPNVSWNPYMIWFDVVIGSVAIVAFILAPIVTLFGDWVYSTSREIMVVFASILAVLAFPLVQEGRYTNDPLWLTIGIVILIGLVMYLSVGYLLYAAGAKRAAANLMVYVFSVIIIALATMYSDDIPLYMVLTSLLIGAVLAVASSPPAVSRIVAGFRRRSKPEEKEPLPSTILND